MSENTQNQRRSGGRTAAKMAFMALAMFGFGFVMVPAYQVFCEVTGFNGFVSNEASAGPADQAYDPDRKVTVEFVATVNGSQPWSFRPKKSRMEVTPGELYTAYFVAENQEAESTVSQIIPSVAPGSAGRHFKKTECFCFTEQRFSGSETREMPVTFFIDPALAERTTTVTLSYTLFDIRDGDLPEYDEEAAELHAGAPQSAD